MGSLWVLILTAAVFAGWGTTHVNFDDGLSKVFESRSEVYDDYQVYLADYESGEGDLLVVFSGRDFAEAEAYDAIREFVFEVQFEPDVASLLSPFSFNLSAQADRGEIDRLWQESPGFRRFLSEDRRVLMVTLIVDYAQDGGDLPLHQRAGHRVERLPERVDQDFDVDYHRA